MTALARVSLTGSYETRLERFNEPISTFDGFVGSGRQYPATDRNWVQSVSTASFSGGSIVLTDGASVRLRTTCKKHPYVGLTADPVDGLSMLHIQTDSGGYTLNIDVNGDTYDGWPGQSKLRFGQSTDIARVWLPDPSTSGSSLISTGMGPLQSSNAGLTWCVGHPYTDSNMLTTIPLLRVSESAGYVANSTLGATAGYACGGGSGLTIKGGYVHQFATTSTMVVSPHTAFDCGLAPMLSLEISGTIATYYGEDDTDPTKVGDGWPGDGTYELWQVGKREWRWRGARTVRGDGSNRYDEIILYVSEGFVGWTLSIESGSTAQAPPTGKGRNRFLVGSISTGSINGMTVSGYAIAPTAFQNALAGETAATCLMSYG